jgi:hypothetical protein
MSVAFNAGMERAVMKGAEFLLEEWNWKDASWLGKCEGVSRYE